MKLSPAQAAVIRHLQGGGKIEVVCGKILFVKGTQVIAAIGRYSTLCALANRGLLEGSTISYWLTQAGREWKP